MKHLGTKHIETERLVLRKFEISDEESMFNNWANDDEVTKFLTWPTHKSIEDTKEVLSSWVEKYQNANFYNWAITLKHDANQPIGSIGIVRQDDAINMIHVGYCIGKKWWNQGITSEALKALIDFFFNEVGANRIESRHDPRNPNSGKVMLKCGLQYEGTMRQADISNQGIGDISMYAILADEYI